jgi:prepilin-type N-terminal cleavage/methylation domain-containing protein
MRIAKRSRSRGGFTLTELMITVALIGTICAIAIPNFLIYQARSRRSEAFTNLGGIGRAYKVYYGDQGRYPDMVANAVTPPAEASLPKPGAGQPNTTKMTWDAQTESFFNLVGWRPDGNVFYTYEVESNCAGVCSSQENCFTVVAHGDVDNDDDMGAVMYVHPMTDAAGNPLASCNSVIRPALTVPVRNGVPVYDEPAVYLNADLY